MSPRMENCPGPSTWVRRVYPAPWSRAVSSVRGMESPGWSVRVLAQKSALGVVYWVSASSETQTACRRPPTRSPSTPRRRYSYSRAVPSMGRST